MGDNASVRELVESYDEITIEEEISSSVFRFSLFGEQFLFFAPSENNPELNAYVFLCNDSDLDIPHIMLGEKTIHNVEGLPDGTYRYVCLFEHESIVSHIISFEDKILDTIDRLKELLLMSRIEREREFQKEFMYYWNSNAADKREHDIYLKSHQFFSDLYVFNGENRIRLIDHNLSLSDLNSMEKGQRRWVQHVECDAFYIPIVDCRGILPPHKGYNWTIRDVERIVYDYQINHISVDTIEDIRKTIPKTQNIILVFGMHSELSNVAFAVKFNCKEGKGHSILEKIIDDGVSVEPLYSKRKDYLFMNEQIGNDVGLLNKKITIIGAGSLGSYVASELVKNGASCLRVFDNDKLEDENNLRWAFGGLGTGFFKSSTLAYFLNLIHPEIRVEGITNNIDKSTLVEESKTADLLVFTIGNSDQQIWFNRVLKEANCSIPVVYVWLEDGGKTSHILAVNYQKEGCYECLFTDEDGNLVNNRSSKSNDTTHETIVRNGCGGTRAAYGTATILRTTAALLEVIRRIMAGDIESSLLIDVSQENVGESIIKFPEEACNCCGNSKKQ